MGCISVKPRREAIGQRGVVAQHVSKGDRIGKWPTIHFTGWIDHGPVFRDTGLAGAIESLHCQTDRIHQSVASGTARVRGMSGQPLARGLIGRVRVVESVEVNIGGWIGNSLTQQKFPDRPAPKGRRTLSRMGMKGKKTELGQQPGVRLARREFVI